ncbi:protein of unknown function [Thauera humireducens]|nr:protein of unknown function [Thauera humireducens]
MEEGRLRVAAFNLSMDLTPQWSHRRPHLPDGLLHV